MDDFELRAVSGDRQQSLLADEAYVSGIEHTRDEEMLELRAGGDDGFDLVRSQPLGKRRSQEIQLGERSGHVRVGLEDRGEVLRPVVEFRQVELGERVALVEERIELGARGRLWPLMPSDKLDAAQSGPQLGDDLDGGRRSGVDDEGVHEWEGGT